MDTNGLSRRPLPAWIALATSSLPVPLSPMIRTVASVGATLTIRARTSPIASESPTRPPTIAPPGRHRRRPPLGQRGRGGIDARHQLAGRERLGQVVEGAELDGLDGRLEAGVAR